LSTLDSRTIALKTLDLRTRDQEQEEGGGREAAAPTGMDAARTIHTASHKTPLHGSDS
jgi:hypothetical protein